MSSCSANNDDPSTTSNRGGVSLISSSKQEYHGDSKNSLAPPPPQPGLEGFRIVDTTASSLSSSYHDHDATRLTCDVLCSLSHQCVTKTTTATPPAARADDAAAAAIATAVPLSVASSFPSTVSSTAATHPFSFIAATAAAPVKEYSSSYTTQQQQHQQHQQLHYCTANSNEHHHEPGGQQRRSSISSSTSSSNYYMKAASSATMAACPNNNNNNAAVAKQHQLPMFLSKTYHMIDRCDPEISTWSDNGESFVVKNVEQFANNVLPLYFKHSNFSSFARQLNFYGFRKLRTDPILTQDVDPRTSAYIRFYHDKFQKDKPELLQHIRRATKTDQQSRDDLDYLKQEISKLHETNADLKQDFDQRIAELSYECNRRVTALNADYDKLYSLVQTFIGNSSSSGTAAATANENGIQQHQQQPVAAAAAPAPPPPSTVPQPQHHSDATAVALAALRDLPNTRRTVMPDLLHSLSHAATVGLQHVVHADETPQPTALSRPQQHQQHAISPPSASHVHCTNKNNNAVVTDRSSGSSCTNSKQEFVLEV